jgi:periplasmic protein TonB
MHARLLSIIVAAGSLTVASALAQNLQDGREMRESHSHNWQREWVRHPRKHKRNPDSRPDRGTEVVLRFVLDRSGHVVSAEVEKSSGDAVVDEAVLATLQHADPLPPPPQSVSGENVTFVLPIKFLLPDRRLGGPTGSQHN